MKKFILTLLTGLTLMFPSKAFAECTKPFRFPVTDSYLTRGYSTEHRAIDLQRKAHDKGVVSSIGDGKVVTVCKGWCGGWGNYVKIDHQNGYMSLYSHLTDIYVTNGQVVSAGDKLGTMGFTGRVRARFPILHLEIYYNGVKINPLSVMQ